MVCFFSPRVGLGEGGLHAGEDEGALSSLFGKIKLRRQTRTSLAAVCITVQRGKNPTEGEVVMLCVSCLSANVGAFTSPQTHTHTHTQGARLDGAFSVGVADGVDQWVGLRLAAAAVAGPVRGHAVLLLTQQGGALTRPVVWPGRGGTLLGGLKVRGRQCRGSAGRGRGCQRERGVVNGWGRGLWQLVPGAWRGDGGQRERRVQPHVAALRGLGHAVQLGGQQPVLVVGTSDLHRGEQHKKITPVNSARARLHKFFRLWQIY